MIDTNGLKKQAAEEAVKYIVSGMIVGLGTGSTVYYALQRISELLAIGELEKIYGIPSSIHTAQEAQKLGIPLSSLDDHPRISITIDGADEVDPQSTRQNWFRNWETNMHCRSKFCPSPVAAK